MAMSKLKRYRVLKEMSQKELGSKCGISDVTISRYETGQRQLTVKSAKKIAAVLGVEWSELF